MRKHEQKAEFRLNTNNQGAQDVSRIPEENTGEHAEENKLPEQPKPNQTQQTQQTRIIQKLPWMHWQTGERVVVRYRGTDGFLHDALGELLQTYTNGVTIQTRSGTVTVHASTMVTGKLVPPPPTRMPAPNTKQS